MKYYFSRKCTISPTSKSSLSSHNIPSGFSAPKSLQLSCLTAALAVGPSHPIPGKTWNAGLGLKYLPTILVQGFQQIELIIHICHSRVSQNPVFLTTVAELFDTVFVVIVLNFLSAQWPSFLFPQRPKLNTHSKLYFSEYSHINFFLALIEFITITNSKTVIQLELQT